MATLTERVNIIEERLNQAACEDFCKRHGHKWHFPTFQSFISIKDDKSNGPNWIKVSCTCKMCGKLAMDFLCLNCWYDRRKLMKMIREALKEN